MIALIDYGAGNLRSVEKALAQVGLEARRTESPDEVRRATAVVLPGVGAYRSGFDGLKRRGLIEPIREAVASGKPFLGICLGLQLLFEESEEDGPAEGLGILKGKVVRFTPGKKIPHMGWNQIAIRTDTSFLEGIPDRTYFYHVHSYHVVPENRDWIATETEYAGESFVSSVAKDRLFACQYHPEKSQRWGLKLLDNFRKVAEGTSGSPGSLNLEK